MDRFDRIDLAHQEWRGYKAQSYQYKSAHIDHQQMPGQYHHWCIIKVVIRLIQFDKFEFILQPSEPKA